MAEHVGTEWWCDNESENGQFGIYPCREDGVHGETIAIVNDPTDAEHIVLAVNAHDALCGEMEGFVVWMEEHRTLFRGHEAEESLLSFMDSMWVTLRKVKERK